MNNLMESGLWSVLETRYPVSFAQNVIDQIARTNRSDCQYIDIKELNDLAAEYRARIKGLIADYRAARSGRAGSTIRCVYASHESIFIRRQVADLWKVYRIVMADSREMTASYLAALDARAYRSSHPTEKGFRAAA